EISQIFPPPGSDTRTRSRSASTSPDDMMPSFCRPSGTPSWGIPSGCVKLLNRPVKALSRTTLSLEAVCSPSDWRRAALICRYCAAIPYSPDCAACRKPKTVPDGVLRPSGSTAEPAALDVLVRGGKIWPSAGGPAAARQALKHTIKTDILLEKQ